MPRYIVLELMGVAGLEPADQQGDEMRNQVGVDVRHGGLLRSRDALSMVYMIRFARERIIAPMHSETVTYSHWGRASAVREVAPMFGVAVPNK